MNKRNKKTESAADLTASDWDNRGIEEQTFSRGYQEYIKYETCLSGAFISESTPAVHAAVELHQYSYLGYGKQRGKFVLPACRPTSEIGQYIMVGPEVRKLFCRQGKEAAYVLWLRLQEFDLMHHQVRDGVWFTGANPIRVSELKDSFPGHSEKWIQARLKEIEKIVGMYKEPRRDSLTNEQLGNAHYPFMLYHPDERTFSDVSGFNENLHDLLEHRVRYYSKESE